MYCIDSSLLKFWRVRLKTSLYIKIEKKNLLLKNLKEIKKKKKNKPKQAKTKKTFLDLEQFVIDVKLVGIGQHHILVHSTIKLWCAYVFHSVCTSCDIYELTCYPKK
jgi:hypothetical protein